MRRRIITSLMATLLPALVAGTPATADGTGGITDSPARTWGTNGRVSAVLTVGASVIIGGDFTSVSDTNGRTYPAARLAKYLPATGTFDLTWAPSTTGPVYALASSGDRLLVGGNFSKLDGRSHSSLGAVSLRTGDIDPTFTTTVDKQIDAIAIVGSSVFLGGPFTTVTDSGGSTMRSYTAKVGLTTGVLDPTWAPVMTARVRSLLPTPDGSKVYVGGDFASTNGLSYAGKLTLLRAADASIDPVFRAGVTNAGSRSPVLAMALSGNALVVGTTGSGGGCTRLDATTGMTQWSKHGTGDVAAVAFFGPNTYCGGHFSGTASFDGLNRDKLAAVDTVTGMTQPYVPGINSALGVWSLGTTPDALIAGGDFTKINTVLQSGLAQFRDLTARTTAAPPASLKAVAGDAAVSLTWDVPSTDGGYQDDSYRIFRSANGGTMTFIGGSSQENFSDPTAVNGTTYTYAVLTRNGAGDSALSDVVQATPVAETLTAPGVPTAFHATGSYLVAQLSWSPPAYDGGTPVTAYRVLRSTVSGGETAIIDLPGTARSYTDQAVEAQTRYYYTVRAVNAIGASPDATEQSAVPSSGVPSAPVMTANPGPGMSFSWTISNEGGAPVTKYVVVRDGVRLGTVVPPSPNTITDPSPLTGTHTYMVKAVNAIGTSKWSNPVTVTTP